MIPKLSLRSAFFVSQLKIGNDTEKSSLWDINDYDKISRNFMKLVQQKEDKSLRLTALKAFENCLDRHWNDKRTGTYFINGEKFEPHQVEINGNTVVNSGLILLSELMSGEAFEVPLWLASGTGTEQISEDQEVLSVENARVSVVQEGWRTSSGNSVKMGARFDPNTPSAAISEFGSFDEITGGDMEWRALLNGPPLAHTQGSTFYMSFHTLYLIPK